MSTTEKDSVSRRSVIRRMAAGPTVAAPSIVGVVVADTSSGEVELETEATIPADTSIEIALYEDLDSGGVAENFEFKSISDGSDTTEYAGLEGQTGLGHDYWMDIRLSTNDNSKTPELDSATVKLPAENDVNESTLEPADDDDVDTGGDQKDIFELWDDFLVFVGLVVGGFGVLGFMSKSMAVGSYAAFLAFAYIASESGHTLLSNILRVALIMILMGYAFKLWRLEGVGEA